MPEIGRLPPHKDSHQDGGADELSLTGLLGGHTYVCRDDPTGPDFTEVNIPFDGYAHDLDLSAIVPVGTIAALIAVDFLPLALESFLYIRKKGNIRLQAKSTLRAAVVEVITSGDLIAPLDSNRITETISLGTIMYCNAVVTGWWV